MRRQFNGKVMAEVRKERGLRQLELAQRVGRNRVTVSDIERGKLQPGQRLAARIADVLGVEVSSLYCTVVGQAQPAGAAGLTGEEAAVLAAMRRCSPIQRAKIWAFAMGLAESGAEGPASLAAELAEGIESALE